LRLEEYDNLQNFVLIVFIVSIVNAPEAP